MDTKHRIQMIRLLDLIHRNKGFCYATGIYDVSTFKGKNGDDHSGSAAAAVHHLEKGEQA